MQEIFEARRIKIDTNRYIRLCWSWDARMKYASYYIEYLNGQNDYIDSIYIDSQKYNELSQLSDDDFIASL